MNHKELLRSFIGLAIIQSICIIALLVERHGRTKEAEQKWAMAMETTTALAKDVEAYEKILIEKHTTLNEILLSAKAKKIPFHLSDSANPMIFIGTRQLQIDADSNIVSGSPMVFD